MAETNDKQAQTILSLGVSEESMKQLKTLFLSEPDEVQLVIKRFAAENKRDFLIEYANWVFLQHVEKQYTPKRIALLALRIPTYELMLKSGMTKEKALAALEIEEHELNLVNASQPTRGAAKKLADIKRVYGK